MIESVFFAIGVGTTVALLAIGIFSLLETGRSEKLIENTKGKLRKHPVFETDLDYLDKLRMVDHWVNPKYTLSIPKEDKKALNSGKKRYAAATIVFIEDGDWLDYDWLVPIKEGDRFEVMVSCVNPDMDQYSLELERGDIRAQYLDKKYGDLSEETI